MLRILLFFFNIIFHLVFIYLLDHQYLLISINRYHNLAWIYYIVSPISYWDLFFQKFTLLVSWVVLLTSEGKEYFWLITTQHKY